MGDDKHTTYTCSASSKALTVVDFAKSDRRYKMVNRVTLSRKKVICKVHKKRIFPYQ